MSEIAQKAYDAAVASLNVLKEQGVTEGDEFYAAKRLVKDAKAKLAEAELKMQGWQKDLRDRHGERNVGSED